MAIQKRDFYEGAALHQIIRGSPQASVCYSPPLFVFNGRIQVHLKYCTAKRSPWNFTFAADEQVLMQQWAQAGPLVMGLICGADGIAALPYHAYDQVAGIRDVALHLACRRRHREHFEVVGPIGTLPQKIAPSDWARLLGASDGE